MQTNTRNTDSATLGGRLLALCLFCCCLALPLAAQQSSFIVRSQPYPDDLQETEGRALLAQDANGFLFIGFSGGLVRFDGSRSLLLPSPGPVSALAADSLRIYLASGRTFGYLEADARGAYRFRDLTPKLPHRTRAYDEITSVQVVGDRVYFYCNEFVLRYLPATDRLELALQAQGSDFFRGIWRAADTLFLNIENGGIHAIMDGAGMLTVQADQNTLRSQTIVFGLRLKDGRQLIGTQRGELFIGYPGQWQRFAPSLPLIDLQDAALLSSGQVLLATPFSGCLILDPATGAASAALNVLNGLPENDVNGLLVADGGRVWLAHSYSFSSTLLDMPLATFPQLRSHINGLQYALGRLYIATDDGLYYLPIENPAEYIVENSRREYIRTVQEPARQAPVPQAVTLSPQPAEAQPPAQPLSDRERRQAERRAERERKKAESEASGRSGWGLFDFLRRKKNTETPAQQQAPSGSTATPAPATSPALNPVFTVRERVQLVEKTLLGGQSPSDVFLRVPGLPIDKLFCMRPWGEGLLVGGANGLYYVKERTASRVLSIQARDIVISDKQPGTLYVAHERGIGTVRFLNGKWEYLGPLVGVSESVTSLVQDNRGALWAGIRGPGILEVMPDADGRGVRLQQKHYPDSLRHETRLFALGSQLYAVAAGRFFVWDSLAHRFRANPRTSAVLAGAANQDVELWQLAGKDYLMVRATMYRLQQGLPADSSRMLGILPGVQQVAPGSLASGRQLWLSFRRSLYLTTAMPRPPARTQAFRAVITRIVVQPTGSPEPYADSLQHLAAFDLPHHQGYEIRFDLAAPVSEQQVVFEYNLNDQGWQTLQGSTLTFHQLSSGSYVLFVRARDAMGRISEASKVEFSISNGLGRALLHLFAELLVVLLLVTAVTVVSARLSGRSVSRPARALLLVLLFIALAMVAYGMGSRWNLGLLATPLIGFTVRIVLAFFAVPLNERLEDWLALRNTRRPLNR